jgi:hypothetical protein
VHGQETGHQALHQFGAWNAKDPDAGDAFRITFQKAWVEKKERGPVRIPKKKYFQSGSWSSLYL